MIRTVTWGWVAALVVGISMAVVEFGYAVDEPSLAWALSQGLMKMGVTQPVGHVATALAPGLSPVRERLDECLGGASDDLSSATVRLLGEGAGVQVDIRTVDEAEWNEAKTREALRRSVAADAEANAVLVQGGWRLPIPADVWGVVIPSEVPEQLSATSHLGQIEWEQRPRTIATLHVTNRTRTARAQRTQVLEAAVRLLRGTPEGSPYANPRWYYGAEAVERVADLAHRWPWCLQCDHASHMCLQRLMRTWHNQLKNLAEYLRESGAACDADEHDLAEAVARLEAARTELAQVMEYGALRDACGEVRRQARYGEGLRPVAAELRAASRSISSAFTLGVRETRYVEDDLPWPQKEWVLARKVPLYVTMPDSHDSFMCAAQILGRVLGNVDELALLRAAAGSTFAFLVDSNAFSLPASMTWASGGAEPLLGALGCSAQMYACDEDASASGQDFMRATIAAALESGVPVLGHEIDGTPGWSIILGYTNYARALLARTPADRARTLRACEGVPRLMLVPRVERMPTRRHVIRSALQRAVSLHYTAETNGYLCGRAAWEWYREQLNLYGEMQVRPGTLVATGSLRVWRWLRTTRREAYRFLGGVAAEMPAAAIILTEARSSYLQASSALNLALADGVVLGSDEAGTGTDWLLDGYLRQSEALMAAQAYEEQAVEHVHNALLQIGGRPRDMAR